MRSLLLKRPETEEDLSTLAEGVLRKAGAIGVLPTPIDDLLNAEKIEQINKLDELHVSFLNRLKHQATERYHSIIQSLRGIADLRERVVYVPSNDTAPRLRFVKAHELAHQIIPWHHIDTSYLDDNKTLSPDIEVEFEREANFTAAELIFQGHRFTRQVRDYAVSFDAVFYLADQHGASRQSTLWRYIEEQDEPIAVAPYYPTNAIDNEGNTVLRLWKPVASPKFHNKYENLEFPRYLRTGHPWMFARESMQICSGIESLNCHGLSYRFEWHAWWNTYTLFVLLRRRPHLSRR
jgi:hypothetical protein